MSTCITSRSEKDGKSLRIAGSWPRAALVAGWLFFALACSGPVWGMDQQTVVVVVGAEGEPEFGQQFRAWCERWRTAAEKGKAKFISIGTDSADASDRDRMRETLRGESSGNEPLWLVLIGHGTYDGKQARFNLRGTDFSATELAEWLRDCSRPLVVVNCSSASAPFLNALGRQPDGAAKKGAKAGDGLPAGTPRRVVVSATKSGQEHNFARFGDFFSQAIGALAADGDKDGQTSLLEAYLWASRRVAEFYEQDSRLATEHALLDDNADGMGTPADWFQGLRATKKAQNAGEVDGRRARQVILVRSDLEEQLTPESRAKRDSLELELERLRDQKEKLAEGLYLEQLEGILRQLAVLYAKKVEKQQTP